MSVYKYCNEFLIVYIYTTIYMEHTQKNKSDQLNVIIYPLSTVNAKEIIADGLLQVFVFEASVLIFCI